MIESDRRDADRAFSSAVNGPGNQQLNLLQAGAGALNLASNREFLSKLEQTGQGQIGQLAQMIQSGEIGRISAFAAGNRAVMSGRDPIAEVAGLRGDIQQLANTAAQPRSVTVQAPDPIANTGRILNDISRQSMRRLGR